MPLERIAARLVCQSTACTVAKSTHLVQHIFGAIQEYGGFEEPRWLDGPPRKSQAGQRRKRPTAEALDEVA
jgi:hypothetical protein